MLVKMASVAVADPPGDTVTQDGNTSPVGPPETDGVKATVKHSLMVVQGLFVMTSVAVALKPLVTVRNDGLAVIVELGEHTVIGVVTVTAEIF